MLATGYVHNLVDRRLSFEEWIWTCARAMGAFIEMRDDGMNAPIPDRFEASSYHREALAKARAELDRLGTMNPTEFADARWKEEQEQFEFSEKHHLEELEKYKLASEMLAKTLAWTPPTPEHNDFKKFMVDQLSSSISYGPGTPPIKPVRKSDADYLSEALQRCLHDIAYHQRKLDEDQEAADKRNKWINELRSSVPLPASMRVKT